ncbi:MAG TPA: alpha/beta-hydrolase N-terminal domain-containing protein, partial [Jiangellaceae bacterium]
MSALVVSLDELVAGRSEQTAMLAASAAVPGTFAPSLTPRSWGDQGVITGFAAGVTYLLTVITHDGIELVAARLPVRGPNPAERQRRAVVLTNLAAIPVGMA